MFCQNCGFQMPDNAKFCGKCGNALQAVEGSAVETDDATSQQQGSGAQASVVQPSAAQQSYTPPTAGSYQTYTPPVSPQQSYSPPPTYSVPVAKPASSFAVASLVILAGAALSIAGFFLPLASAYGVGFSLMDVSFGMGLMSSSFSISMLPLAAFLVGGVLALLLAFLKPKLALLAALFGLGGVAYLFFGTATTMGSSFSAILPYASIGFYLSAAGIVVTIVGGIMALMQKR